MVGMRLFTKPDLPRTKRILAIAAMNDIAFDFVGGGEEEDGTYFGKIPVLDTGKGAPGNEYCIFSSNAIARYLARIRPDIGLYGQNFLESGEVDSWVDFSTNEIEIPMCAWIYPIEKIFEEVPAATAEAKKDVEMALDTLNRHLQLRTFMVGHQVTLADVHIASVLFPGIAKHKVLEPLFKKFPNVQRWWNTVSQFPAFRKAFGIAEAQAAAAAPAKKDSAQKGDASKKGGDQGKTGDGKMGDGKKGGEDKA